MSRLLRKKALSNCSIAIHDRDSYIEAIRTINYNFRCRNKIAAMQYVRDPDYNPIGLVVLYFENCQLYITGSMCHPNDKWNKHLAFFYATQKEVSPLVGGDLYDHDEVPENCCPLALEMIKRFLHV